MVDQEPRENKKKTRVDQEPLENPSEIKGRSRTSRTYPNGSRATTKTVATKRGIVEELFPPKRGEMQKY